MKKINSITCNGSVLTDLNRNRNICYTINENVDDETIVSVKLPENHRPKKSDEIIYQNDKFVNGFKVVKTANGEYAYLRENDDTLLPFRYDIASDFNEFGFALVGKDGDVSWIDKSFRYLNLEGQMVDENLEGECSKFEGWQGINTFSNGDIPLSRVYDDRNAYGKVAYFGIDGKLKEFYKYDGQINYIISLTMFNSGSEFNEKDQAIADDQILFARGYYITYQDLLKLCEEKNFIDSIKKEVDEYIDNPLVRLHK